MIGDFTLPSVKQRKIAHNTNNKLAMMVCDAQPLRPSIKPNISPPKVQVRKNKYLASHS